VPIQFDVGSLTLLLMLAALLGAFAWFWWMHRRSVTDMSAGRKRLALGIRLVILTLLVLALAGMRWVRQNDTLSVIFLVDASKSIRESQRKAALQFAQDAANGKRATDTVGLITFGKDPETKSSPGSPFTIAGIRHSGLTNSTDIAQGLDAGLPLIPHGSAGKVVVLSDGNENVHSALAEVPTLAARGVKVESVLLPSDLKKEALIEKLVVPPRVKIGEPFTVKVLTNALNAQRARLTLRRDGQPIGAPRDVELAAGRRAHNFEVHIDRPGFYRFEALLETDPNLDTLPDNNRGLGFVSVRGKPQILYVSPTPSLMPFLQKAMKEQNIDVVYAPPEKMPTTAAAFQQFDSIILSDVPRAAFSQAQMTAMQVSTRDFGVGFGMIGGENSFGTGGYRNSPIEEMLPISLEIKKQKRLPSVAVALVIEDLEIPASVNMSIEASKALVDLLDPIDEVGVLDCNGWGGYGGRPGGGSGGEWRIPMQHVTDRAGIQAKINSLNNMGDPPSYDPFLLEAGRALQASEAKIKHIIFLGDGDAIWESSQNDVRTTCRKLRNMGITVSTVATAADRQGIDFMAYIAREGGGHAYVADRPEELPRILLKDQQTISAPPIIEEPFIPRQVPGDDVLSGIGGMPQLLGYNIGTPKPTAGVSLISHRNDPILATWRYGLGRSMAFTSDDKNKWAVHWLPWGGYGQFWAQAIRWTMRSFTPSDFQTQVTMEGTRGHISVDAIDREGKFVNRLNFAARVAGPDADSGSPATEMPLRQTGPGHYEAWFDAAQTGTYLVNVTRQISGKPMEMTVTGLVVPYSPEYRDLTANEFLMTQLAAAGGGAALSSPSQVFGGIRPRVYSAVELSHWLILLAMLLFPVDVGVRRLALQREDFARAWAWARARAGRRRRVRRPGATPELARLMSVKERALSENTAILGGDGAEEKARGRGSGPITQSPNILYPTPNAQRPTPEEPEPQPEAGGMSRLMAAKKRAQEQQKPKDDPHPPTPSP
jgi:Ca-activated chloride channel family protein